MAEVELVCLMCEGTFVSKRRGGKYCSVKCRSAKYREDTCSSPTNPAQQNRAETKHNKQAAKAWRENWGIPVVFGGHCTK